jgi:D-hydroxyproline dehydrogenase subunit beta
VSADTFDDAVVGAGIIGLAHAFHLAERGRRVVVLERHSRARGASVRNFGMLWPVGQPAGPLRDLAVRSRALWLDVLGRAGIWHEAGGSLHLAYSADEAAVLEEFVSDADGRGFPCHLLAPGEALARSPRLRPDGLIAAMWSPNEALVDPRATLVTLAEWLRLSLGVTFAFETQVTGCAPPRLLAGTRSWAAERIWICAGDDLQTLYPDALACAGLVRCKLQMMRSQPMSWRLGPMLAAGLTLLHYRGFERCPSLPALRARLECERPDHLRYGVHVLVSQNRSGALTIGDSHEYGDDIEPFDKSVVDRLILDALDEFFDVPKLRIDERWHGHYVKHPSEPYVVLNPAPHVVAVTGVGGAGMTLSFGLAEQVVRETFG